jgi:hypothetical protein
MMFEGHAPGKTSKEMKSGREMRVMLESQIRQRRSASLLVTDEAKTINLAVEHLIVLSTTKGILN